MFEHKNLGGHHVLSKLLNENVNAKTFWFAFVILGNHIFLFASVPMESHSLISCTEGADAVNRAALRRLVRSLLG